MAPVAPRSGDAIFANIEHVNAELFTLTYGTIVHQLLTDLKEVEESSKLHHPKISHSKNSLKSTHVYILYGSWLKEIDHEKYGFNDSEIPIGLM
ncbi:trafficking protein particle complex subunit, putative [Medicago truncatula]|uniref:Trafficking protein particle complex subunit, putative n=1 Tax=Medicago truncatula TaxID=3880 RepID=A0A072UHE9_MEDTR|nr:trafficking protein particle complex subunit, putative [Medicago truncatula]